MRPRRPSPVTVLSALALFFALSGTAIAARHYIIARAANDSCAKQQAALRKAKTTTARAKAKKALTKCKRQHAAVPPVKISPATPYVDEGITVEIHPSLPLPAGQVYKILVDAFGGNIGDGNSHLVSKETTSTSVSIFPTEDPLGGKEWGQGKGLVSVSRGVASTENGDQEVGMVGFRFIAKP
jgi:hypothetical protein